MEQALRRPVGKKAGSRLWFEIHSWVGLKLSIFLSFVLITGTLAVLSNEMDWLTHASVRVEPKPAIERASWGRLYASVREAYPGWTFGAFQEPVDAWFAMQVFGRTPDERKRLIDIDPYTARVQGDRHWMSFARFFRNTHRHLMLPVKVGVPLVSALSLLLILSLVSGLVVYKKFWRGFFKRPRAGNSRVFHGDLHRLLGLWSLWFLPIIAFTGLFYLAESLGWRAPPFGPPVSPGVIAETLPAVPLSAEQVDKLATRAQQVLPGFRIVQMIPPRAPGQPLVFQGYTDDTWLVRPRASQVTFDLGTGRVLSSHRAADANLHQRLSEMADPLHFGYFGGLPTKLLWFVFGGLLSALSITGCVIYGKRVVKSITGSRRKTSPDNRPAPWSKQAWRGMGVWGWVGIAAILISLLLTPIEAQSQIPVSSGARK